MSLRAGLGKALSLGVLVLSVLCAGLAWADEEADAKERRKALAEIREALASRDMMGLSAALDAADALKGDKQYDDQLARLKDLGKYIEGFWKSVDKGAKQTEGEELQVGETFVSMVEVNGGMFVIRVAGANREYTHKNLPTKIALSLANQSLNPKLPENKVYYGAFLLMDRKGDRKQAREFLDAAVKAKLDVAHLLPEFDILLAGPAPEIPPMTPAMKKFLAKEQWQVRKQGAKGWEKGELADAAEQGPNGRLTVKLEGDASAQLASKRTFSGNFHFRIIVENLTEGETAGFFPASGDPNGFTVPLPPGTVLIEFGRLGAKLGCRINGQDVELTEVGKPSPRLTGVLTFSGIAGKEITIAAVDWAAK